MKITVDVTPKIYDCKQGIVLQLTDNIKEMIKDKLLYPRIEQVYDYIEVDGKYRDVLADFDVTDVNIEF